MDELQNTHEIKKFNKWRKNIGKTLPELATRVFNLRRKGYTGCGFHWGLEKDLGWVISTMNNFDKSYLDWNLRLIVEVVYEHFIGRLEEIEDEISQRAKKVQRSNPE
jgi:hypothetical protein